jgi:hypothetical protein
MVYVCILYNPSSSCAGLPFLDQGSTLHTGQGTTQHRGRICRCLFPPLFSSTLSVLRLWVQISVASWCELLYNPWKVRSVKICMLPHKVNIFQRSSTVRAFREGCESADVLWDFLAVHNASSPDPLMHNLPVHELRSSAKHTCIQIAHETDSSKRRYNPACIHVWSLLRFCKLIFYHCSIPNK